MAELADHMPPLILPVEKLSEWGALWLGDHNPVTGKKKRNRFDKYQSVNFARIVDIQFGRCLAEMLGHIRVVAPSGNSLIQPQPDCYYSSIEGLILNG